MRHASSQLRRSWLQARDDHIVSCPSIHAPHGWGRLPYCRLPRWCSEARRSTDRRV